MTSRKTFIEFYSEDDHVQTVGIANNLSRAGSKIYCEWHKQLRQHYGDKFP
jgi:hypothetical protein